MHVQIAAMVRRDTRSHIPRLRRRGRALAAWILELAAVLAIATLLVQWPACAGDRESGVVRIADDEVAVVTELRSGAQRPVLTPGFEWVQPRLQLVHRLDKRPLRYVMEGLERQASNRVPRLVVRARDGSLFWFDQVSIHHGLDLRRLATVLSDTGPSEAERSALVDAFARPVLFEAFGRFTPSEVVQPEAAQRATSDARERLNALLAPFGIEVYEVALSKPSFDKAYENLLERREVGEQEMQSLATQAALLRAAQPALMREIDRKQDLELQEAEATWKQELLVLEQEAERLRGGRPQELAQLEKHKLFALGKARLEWGAEIEGLELSIRELERDLDQRLLGLEREHERELRDIQAEHERALAAAGSAADALDEGHEQRVAALRMRSNLEAHAQAVAGEERLEAARSAALGAAAQARAAAESRIAEARAAHGRSLLEASALREQAQRDQRAFLARAEAFAGSGPLAVRAALIERLGSISFEIAPFALAARAADERASSSRPAAPAEGVLR